MSDDAAALAAFGYELGVLKRMRRAGWWHAVEMLLQAVEYRDAGVRRVDGWIDSARASLKTGTARRIAAAAVSLSPLAWRDR